MSTSIQRIVKYSVLYRGPFTNSQSREFDAACRWMIHYIKRYRLLWDCCALQYEKFQSLLKT